MKKHFVQTRLASLCTFMLFAVFAVAHLASAANDTWTGLSSSDANWMTPANWEGSIAPVAGDSLYFNGDYQTAPNDNFPSGTAFDGIFFASTASPFSLVGNGVLLSGAVSGNTFGVTNGSSLAQSVGLPLNLDWGYYTFSSPAGSLGLNGPLSPNNGGVACFGSGVTSSSLSLDGSGLISSLGGAGLFANGATFVGLATIKAGAVNPYSYTANNVISAAGNIGSATQSGGANIELTSTSAGNYTLANGAGTTFINTILVSNPTANKLVVASANSGTLDLGTANNNIGGIYLPNGTASQGLTIGGGSSCFLTAGPMTGPPTPGEIIFGINGTNISNEAENNALITDNGSGGAVTVVKTGTGSMFNNINSDSYSGGTYVDQGYFQINHSTGMGKGPVYVAGGAEVYLEVTSGNWANNFYISPGAGPSYSTLGAIKMGNGSTTQTISGTLNLLGNPVSSAPGDRIGMSGNNGTAQLKGQITGAGTLELSGQASTASFGINNVTANPNNWTGGLLIDAIGNNNYTYVNLGANNQLAGNNVTMSQSQSGSSQVIELNMDGYSDMIGGLSGSGINAIQVWNSGPAPSTLTLGAGDASATFDGGIYDLGGATANTLSIVKIGAGTQVLDGLNNYSGSTTVINGKLVATTASTGGGVYTVDAGGTLDVRVASAGTGIKMSALQLNPGSTLQVDTSSLGNPTAAPVQVTGALNSIGTINIELSGTVLATGTFPLISYGPSTSYIHTYNLLTSPLVNSTLFDNGAGVIFVTINSVTPLKFVNANSMSNAREEQTATLLPNGKVLVAGGQSGVASLSTAELYDPATGHWTSSGSMNAPRFNHTAVLLPNGKVLVAGGLNFTTGNLSSAELYDPATGIWTLTGSMNESRYQSSAVLLSNGKVLVAGGNGDNSAELYDPSTGTWALTGPMNYGRAGNITTLLPNGKVLVAGGDTTGTSAELYDPVAGTWTVTGSLNGTHSSGMGITLPDGHVIITGGYSNGSRNEITELYDPATGLWTGTGSMLEPTAYTTATLLANGQVLISGGETTSSVGSTYTELYDPSTRMWTAGPPMNVGRLFHTATLLSNGQVLIAGGNNGTGPLYTSELYGVANVPPVISATSGVCAGSAGNTANGPDGAASYAWSIIGGTITAGANAQTVTYTAGSSDNVVFDLGGAWRCQLCEHSDQPLPVAGYN